MKRMICTLLCLVMALSLAACGQKPAETPVATAAPAATEAPAAPAAPAVASAAMRPAA